MRRGTVQILNGPRRCVKNSSLLADYADLALLAHVSRARTTQIMNLLLLAPDTQEAILFLPPIDGSRAPIRERTLRPLCAVPDWRKQRRVWAEMVGSWDSGARDPAGKTAA